ncbi:hypothetical protein [Pseudoalteromonas viridis]|uniref:DUF4274 domain-containing protein n=1 Tax=Pseudoalteromonas viridis TaxID=339617 RepID=A0ABX7V6R4_9GAMM|nr:hypothetical protein [Pseudoalteromonas viridis]QTL36561.1 hypothetical protein J5X90_05845 [Pseudoalteromonas viridis]
MIREKIKDLFEELSIIAETHDELHDTDVRESLHMVLNYFFVWGKEANQLPISYGMFSEEGDIEVAKAINKFLDNAATCTDLFDIAIGKERLKLLQDSSIQVANGLQYDEFIGHADEPLPPNELPEDLFEPGYYY